MSNNYLLKSGYFHLHLIASNDEAEMIAFITTDLIFWSLNVNSVQREYLFYRKPSTLCVFDILSAFPHHCKLDKGNALLQKGWRSFWYLVFNSKYSYSLDFILEFFISERKVLILAQEENTVCVVVSGLVQKLSFFKMKFSL